MPEPCLDQPDHDLARQRRFADTVLPEIPVLLGVAATMTGQLVDAEDLVQDTMVRAWRSLDTFDGRHPRAWLLTVLRHAEINRHRRRRPVLLDDPDDSAERHLAAVHPSAEQVVLERAFDAVVEAALADLQPVMRQVVLLVDVDGLSYAETAAVLGLPEGTVASRLHRARNRIRSRLSAADLTPRRRP